MPSSSTDIQPLLQARPSPGCWGTAATDRHDRIHVLEKGRQIMNKHKKTLATNKCYKAKKCAVEAPLGSFHRGGDVWAETWKWEGSPLRRAGKGLPSWGSSDSLRLEWVWHVQGTDRNTRWQEHERERVGKGESESLIDRSRQPWKPDLGILL